MAAVTASGRLLLSRAVEEDLWQETAEDQAVLLAAEAEARDGGAAASTSAASVGGPQWARGAAGLHPAAPELDVPLAGEGGAGCE